MIGFPAAEWEPPLEDWDFTGKGASDVIAAVWSWDDIWDYQRYLALMRIRKITEVSVIKNTTDKNTNAVPNWTRSVYSFWGILEDTT
jgi:hypothetical protein